MTPELIQLVFPPSLLVLKEWHNSFEAMLKQRWKEQNTLVKEIGEYLNVVSCREFFPLIRPGNDPLSLFSLTDRLAIS
jgi:hypothetical protein